MNIRSSARFLLHELSYWIVLAGLAAYISWMPTVKLLLQSKQLPCFFTDYCEEAAERAAQMCEALSRNSREIEVALNPWRSPLRDTRAGTALPSCSNAFVISVYTVSDMCQALSGDRMRI